MNVSFDDVIMSSNEWPKLRWPEAYPVFSANRQNRDFPDPEIAQRRQEERRNDVDDADDDADARVGAMQQRCRRCVRTQNFASIRRLHEHACKYIRVGTRVLHSLVVFWRVFRAGTNKSDLKP